MRQGDDRGEFDLGIRMAIVAVLAAVVTAGGVITLGRATTPTAAASDSGPPLIAVSTR